jgi:DNA helicase IV
VVIRAPIDQVLVIQGGPGTGKTAVALHRAAYLLFEHRGRLAREGVLVVGPNQAFLDYIANVLPSLGERSVRQATVEELCVPRVQVTADDDPDASRWKGDVERAGDLERAALAAIRPPSDDVAVPIGARTHVFGRAIVAEWLERAKEGTAPVNQRRERVRAQARRELLQRTGSDEAWSKAAPLKSAINRAWPTQKAVTLVDRFLPRPSGRRRRWTPADQLLVDEANSILDGTPFTYGHVVVDEAQDHSAMALRVIARRSPARSMTLVGDVAQSTTPAGQDRWRDVLDHLRASSPSRSATARITDLTIGYRVPEPILSVANRLLPHTGVDAVESRSVRVEGTPPTWHDASDVDLVVRTATVVATVKAHHALTGLVAPGRHHGALIEALAAAGFSAVDHVHELEANEVPLFTPEAVKGLEFDGVVVTAPDEILSEGGAEPVTARGSRLLYVAMTRAVQRLDLVTAHGRPEVLDT